MQGIPLLQTRWVRITLIAGVALASFIAALAIAYELALARVPRHRAALESLVRAQTGLDIRFNELAFRWGWYGPEAVFRRVELGEPGRSNVLLRAPQLIVAINAWQTARSGQLSAGRITLIAPDIDLDRLARASEAKRQDLPGGRKQVDPTQTPRARLLDRWKGGIIDLQGGSIRLPDPAGGPGSLTLQIRRAAIRRSGNEWSGHALVFLPERLGRTARVVTQLTGDINAPSTLSGAVRFEGVRLSFGSWRGTLAAWPSIATHLPVSGQGDLTFDLDLRAGRVEKADGQIRAVDLAIPTPPWLAFSRPTQDALGLDYIAGDWRYQRRGEAAQLQISQLVLDRDRARSPLPQFLLQIAPGHVQSTLKEITLPALGPVLKWLVPALSRADIAWDGIAANVFIDWNAERPEGFRLAASASLEGRLQSRDTRRFTLRGITGRLLATERHAGIEIESSDAGLELGSNPRAPFEALSLAASAWVTHDERGWRIDVPRFNFAHEAAEGETTGTLLGSTDEEFPWVAFRGTVERADVVRLQQAFAQGLTELFGPWAARLTSGRIENGAFELAGRANELFAPVTDETRPVRVSTAKPEPRLRGSFALREAAIPADGSWPETADLDATVEWEGTRVRALIETGRTGEIELEGVEAEWDTTETRAARFSGRAHGRIENVLERLQSSPELQALAPHVWDIVARGDTVIDFDVTVPGLLEASDDAAPEARTRFSAELQGAQIALAPGLPAIESLRGALVFDAGRPQRSTLTGRWLGGPITLSIGERRSDGTSSLRVRARGLVNAQELVALTRVPDLTKVSGETAWSGELVYTPANEAAPSRWEGHAESNLVGIVSRLPDPLMKTDLVSLPLRVELSGGGDETEIRADLGERLRSVFALTAPKGNDWRVARAAIQLGPGRPTLPADDLFVVRGRVHRLDLPGYLLAWHTLNRESPGSRADVEISADEIALGASVHPEVTLQLTSVESLLGAPRGLLRLAVPSLGELTATVLSDDKGFAVNDARLDNGPLTATGFVRCDAPVEKCRTEFELASTEPATVLGRFGFRPELSAAQGSLRGELEWHPGMGSAWLESVTGTLAMRFEDGAVRHIEPEAAGRSFALLTVPALLAEMPGASDARTSTEGAADAASTRPTGELRFTRFTGKFDLAQGQAATSDLHFEGDAEILVRGRTGLIARDYDHQARVLRGEDRIPTSVRRLASAPKVAAAWLTLRDLIGNENTGSRTVLRLRGTWNDPVVTIEEP